MARGRLPDQTPAVPAELFFAFNDLYLYVKQLSIDLAAVEPGGGGSTVGHQIQDEGTPLPQRPILNFTGAGVTAQDTGTSTAVRIQGTRSYFPSGW